MAHPSATARRARPWIWAAAAMLCATGVLAQDIYKWVDASGVTHYTSVPPPPGVPATRLHTAPSPSPEAASQARAEAQRQADEQDRRTAERQRELAQQQVQAEAARRAAADRNAACAEARVQLDALTRGGPVYRLDSRGARVYLEDSARDGEIERWRREVALQCRDGAPAAGGSDAASRQRAAEVSRGASCDSARAMLRDLESGAILNVPAWEIKQARERARRACAVVP